MQRSPRIRQYRVLIVALVAIFLIAGGMFALASGSDSPDSDLPRVSQPLDTNPEVIGSGGPPSATAEVTATIDSDSTRVPTRAATRPRSTPTRTATASPVSIVGSHLLIPTINVNAAVETKGTDADNVMQTPDDAMNVAWYDFTAPPGTVGNAVFAGHVDHVTVGRAVFWDLWTLKVGDTISFTAQDGQTYSYRVTRTATAGSNDAANQYVGPTNTEIITLITCTGDFNPATRSYDQRLIVQGERVP